MDKELLFSRIKELCICNGKAVDKIAKECNVNQNLVAKQFMEVMKSILDKM